MDAVDPAAVRRRFVNSSRSRAAAATFPKPWPPERVAELDFLAWADAKAPQRAYLVVEREKDVVALELRLTGETAGARATMCDWCRTTDAEGGARLVVAPRAGGRGRAGDSVGVYVCSDFACSRRAREALKPHQVPLSGVSDRRVDELVARVDAFVDRVLEG